MNAAQITHSPDRSTLVAAWNGADTERARANIEELLWATTSVVEREQARDEGKANHGRHALIARFVGADATATCDIENRARLCGGNPDVDELWARVEKRDFPLRTAVRMLTDARKVKARDGIELREAIARLLAEYDTWPKRLSHGFLVGIKPAATFSRVRVTEKRRRPFVNDDREFWMKMRELLQKFVERRLDGVDSLLQSTLISEFERELKVLTSGWSGKTERMRQRGTDNAVLLVTRIKVSKACGVLNMDPPRKHGQPINMKVAQSRKRMLAKTYHPDVSPHTRDQYEAVLAAFAVLEDYEEMLKHGSARQHDKQ